ncbi:uncharacterized protein LOC103282325 isoform X1 [Anolis carolinensis]|uniref:uncharacterized protein LOC103282325 isoform X1 n=1 Tax=Anolis carolinensis TaxID=28377 RepID=UPI002F2B4108
MRSRLLLGLVATTFTLVAFPGCGHGAEPGGSSLEEEGDPRKGDVALSRFPRTTLRQRHRIGSFSALSRGLVANMSKLEDVGEEGEAPRQEREANRTHGACWGCCGTRLPDHNGSRQPSKGDSGSLGGTPPPHPPKRNTTKGHHHPGAYTPMRRSDRPLDFGKGVSFFWVKLNGGHQGPNATQDRCRGCCGRNSTAVTKTPERKDEGKGSPSSGGGPIRRPWKPILERDVPNEWPSQKGEDGRWSSFPIDPIEPWKHPRKP